MWIGIWQAGIANGKAKDYLQKWNGRRLRGGKMGEFILGEKMRSWEDGKMRKTSQLLNLLTSQPLQLVLFRRMLVLTVSMIWVVMWLNGHPLYIAHIQGVQWQKERHLKESSMLS